MLTHILLKRTIRNNCIEPNIISSGKPRNGKRFIIPPPQIYSCEWVRPWYLNTVDMNISILVYNGRSCL